MSVLRQQRLAGCPQILIDRLQKVQNAAARLICEGKKTWPCPTHSSVVTLSTNQGTNTVQNFHALLQCNHRHWTTILLWTSHLYTPSRDLSSSADTRILKIPRSNSKAFGQRSFSHVGRSTWTGLPYSLRHSDSQTSFRQALKTHLFQQSF